MKRLFKNKIKWRSGSGELLGFAIIMPFILMMIIAILSITQESNMKQRMTYATYVVARASSICADQERAVDRADAIMREMYGDKYVGPPAIVGEGWMGVDSAPAAIASSQQVHGQTVCFMKMMSEEWRKGDILVITIQQYIEPLMPFSGNFHSQSLAVMIENDAGFAEESEYTD